MQNGVRVWPYGHNQYNSEPDYESHRETFFRSDDDAYSDSYSGSSSSNYGSYSGESYDEGGPSFNGTRYPRRYGVGRSWARDDRGGRLGVGEAEGLGAGRAVWVGPNVDRRGYSHEVPEGGDRCFGCARNLSYERRDPRGAWDRRGGRGGRYDGRFGRWGSRRL